MLTLYTRPNCPLCEEAKLMLNLVQEDFPLDYKEVNIEEDDQVHEKYMLMIPVLEQEDEVLLYGNIGYADLLEALEF
ncbi:MAG TPA: glutaredoxin family protein [Planococcus sp. (in: firmicutes)]|nr:glutaredoxin family protein [Planococcus sp. (in: firmicutes)]